MENQRRHNSWNQSPGGAVKRPAQFWSSIVPSALLEKKEPHPETRAHPRYPQTKPAKEHKRTQPAERHEHADDDERSGGQLLGRSPALHKGGKEEDSSAASDDTEGSNSDENYDEDDNGDDSETTSDASSSATPISQLSYVTHRRASTKARTNLGKRLKESGKTTAPKQKRSRSQPEEVQSNMKSRKDAAAREVAAAKQQRENAIREGAYAKPRPAAHGGNHVRMPQSDVASRDLGSKDQSSDIAQKLAAALATQDELRNTLATLTNEIQNERHAREVAEGTAAADASVEGTRLRKIVKTVVEMSDEESYEDSDEESYQDCDEEAYQGSEEESDEDSDEESDEEEAANRNVNRQVKGCARGKNVSGLRVLPPLFRKDTIWTVEEEVRLFNLRKEGKNWKYVGEELGRTAKAARSRWAFLKVKSLQPIKPQYKRAQRVHSTAVLSAMAKLRRDTIWTAKEEETLFNLRKKGKNWKYIGEELGRTTKAVKSRWDTLRVESLQPIKPQPKGAQRVHSTSVLSAMAKLGNKQKQWTKEEDNIMISLRAQGKTIKYISGRIPGRGVEACKGHWLKIKHQYPQAVTASQDLESNETESPSDHSPFSPASQLDQDARKSESKSRFAVVVPVKQEQMAS